MMMNIVLFDDHKLFGTTLKIVLEQSPDIESFVFVSTSDSLKEELKRDSDRLLLLDINLRKAGVEDSFALGEALIGEYPKLKLAFLSGYDLPMYRKKAKEIGAKGFFSKDIEAEKLLKGLKIIEHGGTVQKREDGLLAEALTATEIKVLELSAKGMSRGEIADVLYVSSRTVGTHLTNIFQKLEAGSITEAIAKALENGYIPPIY